MLHETILRHIDTIPETLIILGSGLNDFFQVMEDVTTISYQTLFNFGTDESIGHSGNLHIGRIAGIGILVMEGRKHYYEDVSDGDMRLMIQSFAELGLKNIVITNACGGMNESFSPGDIMVIEDHINMMGRNPLVGTNNNKLGPRFVDMSEPYDLEFRDIIGRISDSLDIPVQHGVYVSYIGPSYETKAEIKAYRMMGGDAIGMSTVPEVIIARHANLRVLGLSIITNMATGISKNRLSHDEVLEVGRKTVKKLTSLLVGFIKEINDAQNH